MDCWRSRLEAARGDPLEQASANNDNEARIGEVTFEDPRRVERTDGTNFSHTARRFSAPTRRAATHQRKPSGARPAPLQKHTRKPREPTEDQRVERRQIAQEAV